MMERSKAVVVLSGGMDSTTLLYKLRDDGHPVEGIGFYYGQRHMKEIGMAAALCERLGVEYIPVDLEDAFADLTAGSKCALLNTGVPVPEGHYADESMKATVVPNRNMVLLSLAIARAVSIGASAVAYGAHAGDHTIYPDCRPAFADAMDAAARACDWSPVFIVRPFVNLTKADIVAIGESLGVPWADTWSCYNGGEVHCGKCGTCVERREAFRLAGVDDPTEYAG